jgi:hypothetical protein
MKRKEMLLLAIGIFLTIVAWVVVEVYKVQSSAPEEDITVPKMQKYDIDVSVIDKLREKQP